MNEPYDKENTSERERLFKITASLREEDLRRPLPNGWSVATKLLHLAFWDRYCLALLKSWKSTTPSLSSLDVDAVNDAVRMLSGAIPLQTVPTLVREAAEAVDRHVAGISPELRSAIEALGRVRLLNRSIHRRAHLDQIEKALSA